MNNEQFRDVPKAVAEKTDIKKLQRASKEAFIPLADTGHLEKESLSKLQSVLSQVTHSKGEIFSVKGRLKEPKTENEQKVADTIGELGAVFLTLEDKLKSLLDFEGKLKSGEVESDFYAEALQQLRGDIQILGHKLSEYSVPFLLAPHIQKLLFKATVIGSLALVVATEREVSDLTPPKAPSSKHASRSVIGVGGGGGRGGNGSSSGGLPYGIPKGGNHSKKMPDLLGKRSDVTPELGGDGPEGEIEKAPSIAHIEFFEHSTITDPLWVTDYTGFTEGERFVDVPASFSEATGGAEAQVTLRRMTLQEGRTILLPVPVGYKATDVRINGERLLQEREFGNAFSPEKNVENAEVSYIVVATRMNLDIPPAIPDEVNALQARGPKFARTARALRESDSRGTDKRLILQDYFKDFTYIVSSDLQRLIEGMPGSLPDKIGGIRAGDCDTLSAHGITLLQSAGITSSCLANGFLEQNGEIESSRGHAKLLYEEKGGYTLFETTAATDNSFTHVGFSTEDYKTLETITKSVDSSSSVYDVANMYERFGDTLREVLAKPPYESFRSKEGEGSIRQHALKALKSVIEEIEEGIASFNTYRDGESVRGGWEEMAKALLAILSVLAAVGGALLLAEVTKQRLNKKIANQATKKIAALWKGPVKVGEKDEQESEYTSSTIEESLKRVYRRSPILEKIVPLAEVSSWDLNSRAEYLRVMSVAHTYAGSTASFNDPFETISGFLEIRHILGSWKWERLTRHLLAEGNTDITSVVSSLQDILGRPEVEKYVKEDIQKVVAKLWEEAKKKVVSIEDIPGTGAMGLRAQSFRAKSATRHTGEREGDTAGKKRSSLDGDFAELSKYRQGDDVRSIDWKASARRDSLFVRRNEIPLSTAEGGKQQHVSLLIDVVGMEQPELEDLACLLLKASLQNSSIRITEVEFLALGKHVERWGEEQMRVFVTDTNIEGKIKGALMRILTLQKTATDERFQRNMDENWHAQWAYRASLLPISASAARQKGGVVTVGMLSDGKSVSVRHLVINYL